MIAGPNGAGKTSFAESFLPQFAACRRFINADWIAKGLSPLAPELVRLRAGRLMLEEIRRLEEQEATFAFETTLSGKSYMALLERLRQKGYSTHLIFLWPQTIELTLQRIANRVKLGGHDVPEADVMRRFTRSVRNLFQDYMSLVDTWTIFDNSGTSLVTIAYGTGSRLEVFDGTVRGTGGTGEMSESQDEILHRPLLEREQMAMRRAIERVIEQHRRAGIPLAVLRDGKVVLVPAEELNETETPARSDQSANGEQGQS